MLFFLIKDVSVNRLVDFNGVVFSEPGCLIAKFLLSFWTTSAHDSHISKIANYSKGVELVRSDGFNCDWISP